MYVCIVACLQLYICILVYIGVSNSRSSERTRNTITIVWDPARSPNCGPVLYYIVTIVNSVDDNDRNATELSGTRAVLSNLINDTSYNISVAAVNWVGTGPTSTISVTTLTDEEGKQYIYVCTYLRICDWICENVHCSHIYKYLEMPF